jgi:hypothetical protein
MGFKKGSPEAKEWAAKMRAAKSAPVMNKTKEVKQPVRLSPNSVAAGIEQPSGDGSTMGRLIKQLTIEEAENQLDEMTVDDWVFNHYNKGDFNIQKMADVLRESREDIYNRLHALGVELPQGTYSE